MILHVAPESGIGRPDATPTPPSSDTDDTTDAVPYTDNQPIETSNGEQAETNITSTRRRLLGVNVCEGSSLVLSCPPGLVVGSITTAFFGRSDTTSCPYPGAMQNTRCASPTLAVVNAVADKCVCFKSCTVSTSLSSLGLSDPCGGTYKWLSASGTCVGSLWQGPPSIN
eukprot:gene17179-23495_t